ncbi:MAG: hydantoinase/oxoprolinase family protein [Hyphomicrobiaceae bacterium]
MADGETPARAYRIGIDVGGTFTKAVLLDHASREVIGRYSVLTTHAHERGVAAGVVEVFRQVLAQSGVSPRDVIFLAHSTTQATNALLEGDVAAVGIVGIAGRSAAHLAEKQVAIPSIELAPGRTLATANRFLVADEMSEVDVREAIAGLKREGAGVLVASAAFGVDNTGSEELVRRLGDEAGLPTTCGHEITRLYGLTTRTRTAVINASILPRMVETATMTERSVREAGIEAPVMIMRGDGGVMDIREMRRRPAMTMLSGPAASVAGALMHLRVTDGLYFEVGGTSTNIGVIRNGRPTVAYARVGGHETYVNSLDVRVLGVAGGSLVRAEPGRLVDVGPRSAHIAGLPYAAFAKPEDIVDPLVEPFELKAGDGGGYVAVRVANGTRYALTTTCAANVLGYAKAGMHAYGNPEAARRAFTALGAFVGLSAEGAARAVLAAAAAKVIPVVNELIKDYQLETDQCLLIGEGGGAASILPFVAESMGLKHEISRDAEVISSIGVALALIRDVVERIIPHPSPEDLTAIRREAIDAAIRMGADPESVDVAVEVDTLTHRIRAIASGAAEMRVKDIGGSISESEARSIAARSLGVAASSLQMVAATSGLRVYQAQATTPSDSLAAVRVVAWDGAIRIQRSRALVRSATPADLAQQLTEVWKVSVGQQQGRHIVSGLWLLIGRHVVDLSGVETLEQAQALARSEMDGVTATATLSIIAVPTGQIG